MSYTAAESYGNLTDAKAWVRDIHGSSRKATFLPVRGPPSVIGDVPGDPAQLNLGLQRYLGR